MPRTRFFRSVVLLLSACAGACSAGEDPNATPERPPNLVLVVLDTTRPDYLSAYDHPEATTPFLDTFAEQATRYERAYSSSCWTLPAHATMFTGELPGVHRATQSTARVRPELPLLAQRLSDAGYATAGFSVNPWIGKKSGLSRGFETFQSVASNKQSWLAGETDDRAAGRSVPAQRVARWLRAREAKDDPFFLFVNLMRAHHPYVPSPAAAEALLQLGPLPLRGALKEFYPELPEGHARSLMNRHYAGTDPLSPGEWARLSGLYKASLRSLDTELQAILTVVDKWSTPKDTLVLIVSDHGESFGEHGHFGHILNLYETSVRVAFLARGPGFDAGARVNTPVHLADVYSTLLAAAHVETVPGAGIDLARGAHPDRIVSASLDPPTLQLKPFTDEVLGGGALDVYRRASWAVIGERYKWIVRSDGTQELYDLLNDPGEKAPVAPESIDPVALRALRERVDALRKQERAPEAASPEFDAQMLDTLRGLGYVK